MVPDIARQLDVTPSEVEAELGARLPRRLAAAGAMGGDRRGRDGREARSHAAGRGRRLRTGRRDAGARAAVAGDRPRCAPFCSSPAARSWREPRVDLDTAGVILEKMRDAGVGDAAVETFRDSYERLVRGEVGELPERQLEPVQGVPDFDELPDRRRRRRGGTGRAVVIKLNGGLGTSMGVTGPKSAAGQGRAELPRHHRPADPEHPAGTTYRCRWC